jgi:hypothetical protein
MLPPFLGLKNKHQVACGFLLAGFLLDLLINLEGRDDLFL